MQSGNKVDKYNFNGQMQQAEIIENNKGFRDAEIYEGGEGDNADVNLQENNTATVDQKLDADKEYLDYDKAMQDEDLIHKIPYTRLMRVKDWKLKYKSTFEAAKNQALRPNTQQLLNSMIVFLISFIILTGASMGVLGAGLGFISCQPVLYVCILYFIGTTVVHQSRPFKKIELGFWLFLNILYFIAGVVFFIVQYEMSEFTFDVTKRSAAQSQASMFVFLYILLMPTFIHGSIVA